MRFSVFPIAICAACALIASQAFGQDVPFHATDTQSLAQQATALRQALRPGGEYASLDSRSRYLVEQRLDEMTGLFQRHGSTSAMSDAEQVRLFDAEQSIDRLLSGSSAGLWHCEQAPTTGSHLARTFCWPYDDLSDASYGSS